MVKAQLGFCGGRLVEEALQDLSKTRISPLCPWGMAQITQSIVAGSSI